MCVASVPKIVVFSYDAEIVTPSLSGTMNIAAPEGTPRGESVTKN
jgi:hypothetical protein